MNPKQGGHILAMSYYRVVKTGGRRQWVGWGSAGHWRTFLLVEELNRVSATKKGAAAISRRALGTRIASGNLLSEL
jgi:hypothetical protein